MFTGDTKTTTEDGPAPSNPLLFTSHSATAKAPLDLFLEAVARSNRAQATALLDADPGLILQCGTVTDLSGRTFENITALQYAVWALDTYMWQMLIKYIPLKDAADQLKDRATASWAKRYGIHAGMDAYEEMQEGPLYAIQASLFKLYELCHVKRRNEQGDSTPLELDQAAFQQWIENIKIAWKELHDVLKQAPAHLIDRYCCLNPAWAPHCPKGGYKAGSDRPETAVLSAQSRMFKHIVQIPNEFNRSFHLTTDHGAKKNETIDWFDALMQEPPLTIVRTTQTSDRTPILSISDPFVFALFNPNDSLGFIQNNSIDAQAFQVLRKKVEEKVSHCILKRCLEPTLGVVTAIVDHGCLERSWLLSALGLRIAEPRTLDEAAIKRLMEYHVLFLPRKRDPVTFVTQPPEPLDEASKSRLVKDWSEQLCQYDTSRQQALVASFKSELTPKKDRR